MASVLNILGLLGLILAIVNAFIMRKLRNGSKKIGTWVFCVVILYLLLLPVTVFNDLQKQIPDGSYAVPCKVSVEDCNYHTDKATAIITVDSGDKWLSDLKGIGDSGLHYIEDWSSPEVLYYQKNIKASLYDPSEHSYDAEIQVRGISASALGISLSESIAAAGLFEKTVYIAMIVIALINSINLFMPRLMKNA
jgi:hypothetical protein